MARTESADRLVRRGSTVLRDERFAAGVRVWPLSSAVSQPLAVFALTRVLFVMLTYFGVVLYSLKFQDPHPSRLHDLLPAWERWDTKWYEDIARQGYGWMKPGVQTSPTAFFPLYPLLIRIGVLVTHRSYLVVALFVSNLAFLFALVYLWRLTRWEIDEETAQRTILYIAVFPTALFFFAGYTESLFLLMTVASFFHVRRHDWLLAGIFGGLAAATRVTGVLMVLPFVYEYARSRNFSLREIDWSALAVLLIPAGLLAFMVYLQRTVGDALAFSHHQAGWQKVFTFRIWAGFLESARQMLSVQPHVSFFEAHNVLNVTLGGLFLLLTVVAARRLPVSYTLYLAGFWLMTLSNPAIAGGYPVPLVSLSRYVVTLFPIFMILGALGSRRSVHDTFLVLSVGWLSLLTVQFLNGGWIV